jgi:hypothetical protein
MPTNAEEFDFEADGSDDYVPKGPPNHKLKKPCNNCPFRAKGAIELMPGRVPGIIEFLRNDLNFFQCHKTTYSDTPEESMCMGALAFMFKNHHRLPVLSRFAIHSKELKVKDLEACYPILIKPENVK